MDSFTDFEEEVKKELRFNHEFALNESLKEFNCIFNTESNLNVNSEMKSECDLNDEEFEYLFNEFFEEIEENCVNNHQEDITSSNRKRLKLDLSAPENGVKLNYSLQKEIQKYINYLCPECGHEFDFQSEWRTHVFEQHNLANAVETKFRAFNKQKSEYICLVCYQVQRNTNHAELRRHHFEHMPYQAYLKCAICTKTKSSKPKMLQHLQYSHISEIQKCTNATASAKTMSKNLVCLDCDKSYVHKSRFENHCWQCPQRLQPLAVGQYNIEKNMKLLEHLQNASTRIEKLLEEEGVNISNIKLPYK